VYLLPALLAFGWIHIGPFHLLLHLLQPFVHPQAYGCLQN
jgi:hypothetical protein